MCVYMYLGVAILSRFLRIDEVWPVIESRVSVSFCLRLSSSICIDNKVDDKFKKSCVNETESKNPIGSHVVYITY